MYLLYVCVCWRPERIAPSMDVTAFAAQSVRQLLSVHWMRSALSVTHCLVLSDWLAFLLQGKTGWSGVGLSWPGISRSFHTTSHWNCILNVSAWILKHRQDVKNPKKAFDHGKSATAVFLLCHTFSCFFLGYSTEAGNVRPSSSHNLFSVYLRDVFRPPAPHLFVDDTVTCDSSEANRAWSSLPAETLACLPLTDSPSWDKVQAAPSVHPASKILIFFSLWEPVPLRSGRAVLIQNHG